MNLLGRGNKTDIQGKLGAGGDTGRRDQVRAGEGEREGMLAEMTGIRGHFRAR